MLNLPDAFFLRLTAKLCDLCDEEDWPCSSGLIGSPSSRCLPRPYPPPRLLPRPAVIGCTDPIKARMKKAHNIKQKILKCFMLIFVYILRINNLWTLTSCHEFHVCIKVIKVITMSSLSIMLLFFKP